MAERRRELRDFPWSSYRALIGLAESPRWVDTELVLCTWGASAEEQMQNYRRYVEQGLTAKLPSPFLSIQEQSILGSDSFVEDIRRKYLLKRGIGDEREETSLKHLVRSENVGTVIAAVGVEYGICPAELLKRRSVCREGRQLAMYLVATLCRHERPPVQLAKQFGVTNAGLGIARSRMAEALTDRDQAALRARCDRVRNALKPPPSC
ncbi:MAG: hypothetical protein HN742_26330 [Lentisphaerae bacterium]|nr:hypothetical protein [Lentisphaerota bacterium]MBT4819341.1 hypothetical protein [Lentisphaerota bacterium]MBT5606927.1 hypothetical protein [Lentisphaerota bacterium]MBT7845419.1 hypothetical protein [Lentisphaerota bacterium]